MVPDRTDWLLIGQFVFSSLAALLLVGFFLASTLSALFQDLASLGGLPIERDFSPYLFAAGLGAMGLLMVFPAAYAARRLFGNRPPRQLKWERFTWISYLLPLPFLLGFGALNGPDWAGILLPLAHVLANTAGVFFLLDTAQRKLPAGSGVRFWGAFGTGLGLTPLVAFILEALLLAGIGLVWVLMTGLVPAFRQDLLDLAAHLQQFSGNMQSLQRALGRFAARPAVLVTLFTYIAVLIPILEEILKPAAVWLLLGRKLQSREGFLLGATSGAGYALFENLTIGAAAGDWIVVAVTRMGTAGVHIFTAGLMGWGLASAFSDKKYGRLGGAFLGAVALHGLWNGLNILTALSGFTAVRDQLGPFGARLGDYAPAALVLLALGCLWGLIRANSVFRRDIIAEST